MQAQCKHRASANRAPHAARQTAHFDCEPGFHRPVTIWAKAHVFFFPPNRCSPRPGTLIHQPFRTASKIGAKPMGIRVRIPCSPDCTQRFPNAAPNAGSRRSHSARPCAHNCPQCRHQNKQKKKTVPIPVRPIALPPACSSDTCRPASANSQAILAVPALANPLAMRTCPRHMPSLASLQTPPWQTFARRLFFFCVECMATAIGSHQR